MKTNVENVPENSWKLEEFFIPFRADDTVLWIYKILYCASLHFETPTLLPKVIKIVPSVMWMISFTAAMQENTHSSGGPLHAKWGLQRKYTDWQRSCVLGDVCAGLRKSCSTLSISCGEHFITSAFARKKKSVTQPVMLQKILRLTFNQGAVRKWNIFHSWIIGRAWSSVECVCMSGYI